MKNSLAFVELAFAASHVGAVFLPINFRLSTSEIAYILENSGAKLLLADAEFATTVASLSPVVLIDTAVQSDSTLLDRGAAVRAPMPVRQTGDLFRLMYTSGTTDHPKGVMHGWALHRRLWPHRDLQRRHAHGGRARDREDRLGWPRACPRCHRDPRQHCRKQLAGFKVPSHLIVRGELPRNPSGKILKRVLRDELVGGRA